MRTLAIDFGGSTIKYCLSSGGVRSERQIVALTGLQDVLDTVERGILNLQKISGMDGPVDAVCIAVPGILSADRTSFESAPGKYADLQGVNLRNWAMNAFHPSKVVIENDARAALVGELAELVPSDVKDAAILVLGTGIGTAAIVDGQMIRGSHEHGAVLGGHFTVSMDGPECPCGNVGCAEALASTWALNRDAAIWASAHPGGFWHDRLLTGGVGLEDVYISPNDPFSIETSAFYAKVWGAVVVSLCHAFDPEVFILAGGVMGAAESIVPAIETYVDDHLWRSMRRPRFVVSASPSESVLCGLLRLGNDATKDLGDLGEGVAR